MLLRSTQLSLINSVVKYQNKISEKCTFHLEFLKAPKNDNLSKINKIAFILKR